MGDYTKLIVDATVSGVSRDELDEKIAELDLGSSAYHTGGVVIQVNPEPYTARNSFEVILVGQTKYGGRQHEFLEWLKPYVVQGSGVNDMWAIQLSEYTAPFMWKLNDREPDEY